MNTNLKLIIDGVVVGLLSSKTIPRVHETIVLNDITYKVDDVVYSISLANSITKTFHTDEVHLLLSTFKKI